MKKTLLILAFATAFTFHAQAYDFASGRIAYNIIDTNKVEVCGIADDVQIDFPEDKMYVDIPSIAVDYNAEDGSECTYTVVRIGDSAFENRTDICGVGIPNSVREIGTRAFAGCILSHNIVIPDNTDKICDEAFANSRFNSFYAKGGLTEIGDRVFEGAQIKNIDLRYSKLSEFGKDLFTNTTITSVALPENLTSLPENSFKDCVSLNYIILNNTLKEIGENAFSNCTSLCAMTFPNGLTQIAENAFSGTILKSVAFNSSEAPSFSSETIFNGNTPSLIDIPADSFEKYLEWCPGISDNKVCCDIASEFSAPLWTFPGIMNYGNADKVVTEGVVNLENELSKILIDKGSNLSLIFPMPYGAGNKFFIDGEEVQPVIIDQDIDNEFFTGQFFLNGQFLLTFENMEEDSRVEVILSGSGVKDTGTATGSISYDSKSAFVSAENNIIRIFDISGKCVMTGSGSCDVSTLSPGLYMVKTGEASRKIMVR